MHPTKTTAPDTTLSGRPFRPDVRRHGSETNTCSLEAIRPSCELQGKRTEAEANIIIAVGRPVVVAVSGAAVLGVVAPAAAAVHAVLTLWRLTTKRKGIKNHFKKKFFGFAEGIPTRQAL